MLQKECSLALQVDLTATPRHDDGAIFVQAVSDYPLVELSFAAFLDQAPDVVSFGKNYKAVGFRRDYVKVDGDLSNYTPYFIVKTRDGEIWIVETKGREELAQLPQHLVQIQENSL